ncbi:unnamed protein product [Rhizophagus irregularis]|uniref:Uncharacterized protein n=1 Tax=Rhizophagus irregularis TaxID=588596 RepID=A0A2I1GZI2_9GLOM|nr:hypothetical protein RhiirA4_495488 [Rhizophagus irregularis]CAB4404424.1 unnamed protein product [Rhizophagus irregularis]
MTSYHSQLKELKDKNDSIRTPLDNKMKLQEDLILTMKDDIIDQDWNSCIKTIEELSDNTKHIHQIMDQQMEVSNKSFSLIETVIDDLNDTRAQLNDTKTQLNNTETRVKILGTFRDYIKLFLIQKVERELGKSEWYEVKNALFEKRVLKRMGLELDERDDVVKKLGGFLFDNYNITMEEFELLLEMRDKSNKAFHDNEKSIEQAKTLLKEQFPDDLQKYKGPLSKVLNVFDKK